MAESDRQWRAARRGPGAGGGPTAVNWPWPGRSCARGHLLQRGIRAARREDAEVSCMVRSCSKGDGVQGDRNASLAGSV